MTSKQAAQAADREVKAANDANNRKPTRETTKRLIAAIEAQANAYTRLASGR